MPAERLLAIADHALATDYGELLQAKAFSSQIALRGIDKRHSELSNLAAMV
jgi:hypothetical protein